jgi:fatty-acyl-CoA synthase
MAAQHAFEAALEPLKTHGIGAAVTVRDDATHGTLATVRIATRDRVDREAIIERCGELLGGFQIRHTVDFGELTTA